MVQAVDAGVVQTLRSQLAGEVFTPTVTGYDDARSIWNGAIDRRPAIVARCASSADVANALRFGREHGLQVSVRGGDHNFAGFASCDDGLMISLAAMNEVRVQPAQKKASRGGTPADGQVLTASADEHPDLFWAVRGGGGKTSASSRSSSLLSRKSDHWCTWRSSSGVLTRVRRPCD